jgi:hypothetical protein
MQINTYYAHFLVELLQGQKQVRLERLAANLPLPILFESRRRQLQRFLISPKLAISSVWFALINYLLMSYFSASKELTIVVDRTQWRDKNLLMVSIVWQPRAIPLHWYFLPHKGNSSFAQQQAVIQAVLPLLKNYRVTVLGEREFCSVELGQWLKNQGLAICLRLRRSGVYSPPNRVQSTVKATRIETRYVHVLCRSQCN